MSVEHVSRCGKVYYLHGRAGKGGKPIFYFSTEAGRSLVDVVPIGYEIYETVGGQVFLRRIPKKLITDRELNLTRAALTAHAEEWRYKIDVKKNIITIYETDDHADSYRELAPWIDPAKEKQFRIQHAYYVAVLRFILMDPAKRLFAAERYCFRGSVDDWMGLDRPQRWPCLQRTTSNTSAGSRSTSCSENFPCEPPSARKS
jgi:hypothetical protein